MYLNALRLEMRCQPASRDSLSSGGKLASADLEKTTHAAMAVASRSVGRARPHARMSTEYDST